MSEPQEPRIRNAASAAQVTGRRSGVWRQPAARPAVLVHVELVDGRVLEVPGRALGWRRAPDVFQVEVVIDGRTLVPWMPASTVRRRGTPSPEDSV